MRPIFITRYYSTYDFKKFIEKIKKENPRLNISWRRKERYWALYYIIEVEDRFQDVVNTILNLKQEHDTQFTKGCKKIYPKEYVKQLVEIWNENKKIWNQLDLEYEVI